MAKHTLQLLARNKRPSAPHARVYAGGSVSGSIRTLKPENGPIPTVYTDDATVNNLGAEVTEQRLAIIDLETQQALASYQLIAAATGGKPVETCWNGGVG
ncbi:hypothetical protein [Brevundimonas sp. C43]|uniref:hypothetical protein n=1 Tax=Brevundimonas sp. C43 TaxID=3068314 RepID=UPI00273F8BEA|nr:hypothetical protein [Brevundimonas sp. C43]